MPQELQVPDELELRKRIASNLAFYRKLSGLTQTELAERINYSDKSVSKWERAAGVPDIHVLVMMAELFGITVDDFISESAPLPKPDAEIQSKRRVITCLQLVAAVWVAVTAVFACLMLFAPGITRPWLSFIVAIPASAIVCVVFSTMWWGHLARLLSVSALAWTTAVCAFLLLLDNSFAFLIFIVCAAIQVLVLLWFVRNRISDRTRYFSKRKNDQTEDT